ncbi:MAG: LOG family protein [Chloroflexi bacterium]|nr:LOG family protein [Chloroflexota bacterium]
MTTHSPKVVTVFGTAQTQPGDADYAEALLMGRLLAEAGYAVTTGGYYGAMEAISRGAKEAGGFTRGITMTIFDPRPANQWVDDEEKVLDFFIRLEKLIYTADAYVVLRGGIGTLTELGLTWSLLQTNSIARKPLVLVGDHWAGLFTAFRDHCIIRPRDYELITLVRTPAEAAAHIQKALAR